MHFFVNATIKATANVIKFDYQFTSASGAEGVLSVEVDNQPVDKIDERFVDSGLNEENNIWVGDLAPGEHTISFRLDPFTGVHSIVSISNVQLGFLHQQTSIYIPPTASFSIIPPQGVAHAATSTSFDLGLSGIALPTDTSDQITLALRETDTNSNPIMDQPFSLTSINNASGTFDLSGLGLDLATSTDANGTISITGSLDDLASMLTDFGISSFSDFLPMVQDTTSTITTTFANPGTYTLSIEASDARGIIANASTTMVVVGE